MERKKYSKPFMRSETFTPEAFIAACTMPGSYSVYAPFVENGRADGWQSNGINMDDWYQNNWRIYFDSYTIELVSENDYQYDQQGTYWKIVIGSQGMLVYDNKRGHIEYSGKNPLPQGTIIYKNLGNAVESGQVEIINKNHS